MAKRNICFMGDSQNTRGKIITRSVHNGLKYCVMFTVHTEFTKVVAVRIILAGSRPLIGKFGFCAESI
jgi:hypothetical protein